MKILNLALAVLLVQETLAWDINHWSGWWWKQDATTPAKSKHHHKHHKHYRQHHHYPQTCVPTSVPISCTTAADSSFGPSFDAPIDDTDDIEFLLPDSIDPFFPYNIGGNLNDTGVNCSDSLTNQVV